MNKKEHLLTILIEECAEVQQAATKTLRFGLKDRKKGVGPTNEEHLAYELNDLSAVVELLNAEGMNLHHNIGLVTTKKMKVGRYLEYSRELGTFDEQD